jgi:hypothetical protein
MLLNIAASLFPDVGPNSWIVTLRLLVTFDVLAVTTPKTRSSLLAQLGRLSITKNSDLGSPDAVASYRSFF